MAVAFDAATEFATFTTTSPATVVHTPVGTPRGVIVGVVQSASTGTLITSVSYGGVAMTRYARAIDNTGELGTASVWFLGEAIPAGAQTVSIVHTATSIVKWAAVATVTASADTEVGVGSIAQDNRADPQVVIGKQAGMCFGTLFSGHDDVSSLVPLTGCETVFSEDFGTDTGFFFRQSAEGSGLLPFGYTALTEDAAIVGSLIVEKVAGVRTVGSVPVLSTSGATSAVIDVAGDLTGQDMYLFGVSRDHTSGTGLATCTDNSGGNTWTLVSNDTDRQLYVFQKKGVAGDQNSRITFGGAVGSCTAGFVLVKGGAVGNPTTDLTVEANASGDETHAGFTPTSASELVFFGVADVANDTNAVTSLAAATLGTMEPELFERLSTGGNDCRLTVTAKQSPGGPTGTGNFTWTQGDSTTKSVAFAVSLLAITGTGASTLGGVTSAGSGTYTPAAITGTGTSTFTGVTSAGAGAFITALTGTGASTLQGVTSVGVGVFTGTGGGGGDNRMGTGRAIRKPPRLNLTRRRR